ncbi:hypothetical protein DL96DRAFT_184465 [Flagelloscypha sp. PMI_526]|nr:hypothetical protein DL96DRAFT_184465 [Flagelloscypha sp. PMI_526]
MDMVWQSTARPDRLHTPRASIQPNEAGDGFRKIIAWTPPPQMLPPESRPGVCLTSLYSLNILIYAILATNSRNGFPSVRTLRFDLLSSNSTVRAIKVNANDPRPLVLPTIDMERDQSPPFNLPLKLTRDLCLPLLMNKSLLGSVEDDLLNALFHFLRLLRNNTRRQCLSAHGQHRPKCSRFLIIRKCPHRRTITHATNRKGVLRLLPRASEKGREEKKRSCSSKQSRIPPCEPRPKIDVIVYSNVFNGERLEYSLGLLEIQYTSILLFLNDAAMLSGFPSLDHFVGW